MNCYDLLIEMLEAQAQEVDKVMMRDGSAHKIVRSGGVVCLDHSGGEMYVWPSLVKEFNCLLGFNVLDTANGEPVQFDEWDDLLSELDDEEDC